MHYEKFSDGTIKCIEDEIPFDIPESWCWTRLGNISSMSAGKFKASAEIGDKSADKPFPCYGGNGIRGYVKNYSHEGFYHLIGRQGALCGNINIASGKFYATEHAVVVTLFQNTNFYWIYYLLCALNLNQYSTGAAQPGLSVEKILNTIVPLPPHNEQKLIACHVDNVLTRIKLLDSSQDELKNYITILKSKILDLAIRGKLVPQDPNDEPASVLLERIKAEKEELIKQGKIKRDKAESTIFKGDDNSYYEKVLSGWAITNLETVIDYEQPTEYLVNSTDYKNEYPTPVLTAGKSLILGYTNETNGIFTDTPVIIFDDFTTECKYVDFPFKVKSTAMKILHPNKSAILSKYAYYLMKTIQVDHENHQRYWISTFSKEHILLPPLSEQQRIIECIELYFGLLDGIAN